MNLIKYRIIMTIIVSINVVASGYCLLYLITTAGDHKVSPKRIIIVILCIVYCVLSNIILNIFMR